MYLVSSSGRTLKGSKGDAPSDESQLSQESNKLYVGNLDYRVTEYLVIKMFSPFGKILSEEYMWHTHGPKRGEPRGFAFVEFSKREEAENAKKAMNGKLAFGRPLMVRFIDEKVSVPERPAEETPLQNALITGSTHPSVQTSRSAKIAAIKNKLWALEKEGVMAAGKQMKPSTCSERNIQ